MSCLLNWRIIEPRIWRRILVPAPITLPKLHDLLQLVMRWTNSYLHSFRVGEKAFSTAHADLGELSMLDEKNAFKSGLVPEVAPIC